MKQILHVGDENISRLVVNYLEYLSLQQSSLGNFKITHVNTIEDVFKLKARDAINDFHAIMFRTMIFLGEFKSVFYTAPSDETYGEQGFVCETHYLAERRFSDKYNGLFLAVAARTPKSVGGLGFRGGLIAHTTERFGQTSDYFADEGMELYSWKDIELEQMSDNHIIYLNAVDTAKSNELGETLRLAASYQSPTLWSHDIPIFEINSLFGLS